MDGDYSKYFSGKSKPKKAKAPSTVSKSEVKQPLKTDTAARPFKTDLNNSDQQSHYKLMVRKDQPSATTEPEKIVAAVATKPKDIPPDIYIQEPPFEPNPAESKAEPLARPSSGTKRPRSAGRSANSKEKPVIAGELREWRKDEFIAWVTSPKEDFGRAKKLLGFE